MMREDEIERLIEELPSRGLSADAEGRIVAAMSRAAESAGGSRPMPWWSRGVPLWMAAAACVAMCAATAMLVPVVSGVGSETVLVQGDAQNVEPSEAHATAAAASTGLRTRIAGWKVLEARTEAPS